jgi:hypothetical protein
MHVAPETSATTAPNAAERQSFLDNVVTDLSLIRASDYRADMSAFWGKTDMGNVRF